MKPIVVLLGSLLFMAVSTAGATTGQQGESAEKTLSPYFFVETSDGNVDQFPLKSTEVDVAISGIIADVTVRQRYANMGASPINGRYVFPASTRAAVHGMKMTIGDRQVVARIKEKSEARKVFAEARRQGKSSSLLEQKRPNVFSMDVANIMPGDTVDIELRYTELLVPEKGQYEFVYPTVVGPRYSTIRDDARHADENWVKNPYLRNGAAPRTAFTLDATVSAGMPIQEIACPTHQTSIRYSGQSEAHVELDRAAPFGGDRDYILRYRLAGRQITSGLLLYHGEAENYFMLMAEPPRQPAAALIPSREYIFVVDVSGSMHGFPLDTAKQLMGQLLGGLRPTDSFNILLFAGDTRALAPQSLPATPNEIRRALDLLDSTSGGGGTELLGALREAYRLPRGEAVSRSLIVVTDGFINAEPDVFGAIRDNLGEANVFAFGIGSSVNRYLIEGMARSGRGEPFVVTSPNEAEATAHRFAEYVASPLLTDIAVTLDGFDAYDIEPGAIPDLFADRPVVVFGKWRGPQQGTVVISGKNGEGEYRQVFDAAAATSDGVHGGLGYLWARERIARLSDYGRADQASPHRQEIVDLGLAHNLLTAYTSFVAVDEVVRNPSGQAETVKQPLPLPQGVSNLAVGELRKVPEPELKLFILLGFAVALWLLRRRRSPTDSRKDAVR